VLSKELLDFILLSFFVCSPLPSPTSGLPLAILFSAAPLLFVSTAAQTPRFGQRFGGRYSAATVNVFDAAASFIRR